MKKSRCWPGFLFRFFNFGRFKNTTTIFILGPIFFDVTFCDMKKSRCWRGFLFRFFRFGNFRRAKNTTTICILGPIFEMSHFRIMKKSRYWRGFFFRFFRFGKQPVESSPLSTGCFHTTDALRAAPSGLFSPRYLFYCACAFVRVSSHNALKCFEVEQAAQKSLILFAQREST